MRTGSSQSWLQTKTKNVSVWNGIWLRSGHQSDQSCPQGVDKWFDLRDEIVQWTVVSCDVLSPSSPIVCKIDPELAKWLIHELILYHIHTAVNWTAILHQEKISTTWILTAVTTFARSVFFCSFVAIRNLTSYWHPTSPQKNVRKFTNGESFTSCVGI